MKISIFKIVLGSLLLVSAMQTQAESRSWSNREGKVIKAELVKYDSQTKKVTLKL